MLFESIHPIIAIDCDTRCITTLKIVSIPVSLSYILGYGDTPMYHPISASNGVDVLPHIHILAHTYSGITV